ncbi:MAG: glycoside hydrolase family 13 protein [Parasporobacterium sp.]|nr:glycoside hydrolase family 13 protein [Parasporobacterium sp.]
MGSKVTLSLYAPDAAGVKVRLWWDGHGEDLIDMYQVSSKFMATITLPHEPCALFYYFIVDDNGSTVYYGNNQLNLGGQGQLSLCAPPSYQITVYRPTPVPEWYKNGVVYQIFPDRFARSSDFDPAHTGTLPDVRGGVERVVETDWDKVPVNEFAPDGNICRWRFYGGSLDGITEKLDYLESIGVTVLYLNPVFAARSNHRYDTADYNLIDPVLGDEASFVRLASEAKKHGIRLILDGVFNHCGADSRYFDYFNEFSARTGERGARRYKTSPYRSWFDFTNTSPGYRCWWGIADLPDFNTSNPDFVEFITGKDGIVRKWLRLGASGWRLDVADELPNDFIKAIRKAMKEEDPDSLLLGEVWDDPTNKYNYGHIMEYFWGEELDSTMNYQFRASILNFITGEINANEFCARFMSIAENYPAENFYGALNLLGSHDRERVLNILGGNRMAAYGFDNGARYSDLDDEHYKLARTRYKMLSVLQFCLPGVPDIYYGDEAGVMGGADPDCRRTYPWNHADEDLVNHFKWLGSFYHEHPVLKNGDFRLTDINDDVIALERFNDEEHFLMFINRSDRYMDIEFNGQTYNLWAYDAKII